MGGEKESEFKREIAGQLYRVGELKHPPEAGSVAQSQEHTPLPQSGEIFTAKPKADKQQERPLRSRSRAEKREAVKEALLEHPERKYWEIGKQIGLTSKLVQNYAHDLGRSGEVAYRRANSTKEAQAKKRVVR